MALLVLAGITLESYGPCCVGVQAYLDPGSGSILLQVLLGGAAGLAVLVRLSWHRVLTALRLRRPEKRDR